jgi:hypothetical protein
MSINNTYNFDDRFFRMIGLSLTKTFTRSLMWINRFEDKKIRVIVPFYLSMTGDERFLLDAFVDDVVDKRIELNTDMIPRGIITLTSINASSDEFANPNQFLSKKTTINEEYRKIISKVKAIPITINYDVNIKLDTELDVYIASEKILKMFFNYMFFNIDYFGLKIDSVLTLPDDKAINIVREQTLDSDTAKNITFSLAVKTYYPDFFIDTDDYEICDNDTEIDWDKYGLIPPSERGEIPSEKRVYWENYVFNSKSNLNSIDNKNKENF